MATVLDKVKAGRKNLVKGPGGVLQEETEDLQSLAGKTGLAAPPTTALGASLIGANPDQQKMAGSPAQMESAMRLSLDSGGAQTLAEADRRRQTRTQTTGAERSEMRRGQALEGLSDVDTRVQQLIDTKIAEATPKTGVVPTAASSDTAVAPIEDQKLRAAQPLLAEAFELAKNNQVIPADLMLRLNEAFGRDPNSVLAPAEISQLYVTATEAVARQGADAIQNSLTVSDLAAMPNFGYDLGTLSSLLGVPTNQLKKASVAELQALIDQAGTRFFGSVEALEQQAGSGNLGEAERQLARQSLREASATGIRATEADFQKLEQAIADAEEVEFGGKNYKIEELLKDETVSSLIKDYLENSEVRAELLKTEPAFAAWIDKHSQLFKNAVKSIETAATSFGELQKQNKEFTQAFPESLVKHVFPDAGGMSAESLSKSKKPIVQFYNTLKGADKGAFSANLTALVQAVPGIEKELANLTTKDLKALDLGKQTAEGMRKYIESVNAARALANLDSKNPDALIAAVTGGKYSGVKELETALRQNNALKLMGFPQPLNLFFDANGDGVFDGTKKLAELVGKSSKAPTLKDFLAGKDTSLKAKGLNIQKHSKIQQLIINKSGNAFNDNKISANELQKKLTLSLPEIATIVGSPEWGQFDAKIRMGISHRANALRKENTQKQLRAAIGDKTFDDPLFNKYLTSPKTYLGDLGSVSDSRLGQEVERWRNLSAALTAEKDKLTKDFPMVDPKEYDWMISRIARMSEIAGEELKRRIAEAAAAKEAESAAAREAAEAPKRAQAAAWQEKFDQEQAAVSQVARQLGAADSRLPDRSFKDEHGDWYRVRGGVYEKYNGILRRWEVVGDPAGARFG